MNTDLQKRLEEAAKEYAKRVVPECISSYEDFFNNTTADFINGAKYSYKEAIEQVKEWLKWNTQPKYIYIEGEGMFIDNAKLLADFEADMNKLWEEKK